MNDVVLVREDYPFPLRFRKGLELRSVVKTLSAVLVTISTASGAAQQYSEARF